MANHVLDWIFKPLNPDSGRDIDLVQGARGEVQLAGCDARRGGDYEVEFGGNKF